MYTVYTQDACSPLIHIERPITRVDSFKAVPCEATVAFANDTYLSLVACVYGHGPPLMKASAGAHLKQEYEATRFVCRTFLCVLYVAFLFCHCCGFALDLGIVGC